MQYFNQEVLTELTKVGVLLSDEEKTAYVMACRKVEQGHREYKTKKNTDMGRRFSVWHTPVSDNNDQLNHWLVLPGFQNWKTKGKLVVSKVFLNILTAEKKFVKVRRPETQNAAHHLVTSESEFINAQSMGVKAQHYARYSLIKGTKAYLFQPYRGRQNLYDFVLDPATSSRQIINMLLTSAELLQRLHARGFLHLDIKPQNYVVSDDKQNLTLVDLELMLTVGKGAKGLQYITGTELFMHPEWLDKNYLRIAQGQSVHYSTHNDIAAFLIMAELMLGTAFQKEQDPEFQQEIRRIGMKIKQMKNLSFGSLPDLSTVQTTLSDLVQPELLNESYPAQQQYRRHKM